MVEPLNTFHRGVVVLVANLALSSFLQRCNLMGRGAKNTILTMGGSVVCDENMIRLGCGSEVGWRAVRRSSSFNILGRKEAKVGKGIVLFITVKKGAYCDDAFESGTGMIGTGTIMVQKSFHDGVGEGSVDPRVKIIHHIEATWNSPEARNPEAAWCHQRNSRDVDYRGRWVGRSSRGGGFGGVGLRDRCRSNGKRLPELPRSVVARGPSPELMNLAGASGEDVLTKFDQLTGVDLLTSFDQI
ncbi:hypothetical protein LIER_05200 [Lithospermum erythrorhizon]|uniref:Uncharacterized protein n=1 Tax=Lithospermum erythrorhizon TaxID=34254 RepID=A0AAV3P0J0_LITER